LALPSSGRVGAAIQIHSPSGKRVHPRFNVPFTVEIAGARYSGVNLSLGGIGPAGPSLSASEGEIFKAAISFAFATHEVTVPAYLAAVRRDASDHATAFQFLDLNMDTARVFQTITDKWASGDLLTLDPVIAAPGSGTALALPGPVVRVLRGFGLAVRYGAVVTGAGVMIALLGSVLYDRWFSIVPEQAAVASDAGAGPDQRLLPGTHPSRLAAEGQRRDWPPRPDQPLTPPDRMATAALPAEDPS
jgi:alginate biosynthesis protein Alg44